MNDSNMGSVDDLKKSSGKRSKYRNRRTRNADGTWSDSALEARWDQQIMALKNHPDVTLVRRKVRYPLIVNGTLIAEYECDWEVLWENNKLDVYDAKGYKTKEYKIKKKLMKVIHDIDIIELE